MEAAPAVPALKTIAHANHDRVRAHGKGIRQQHPVTNHTPTLKQENCSGSPSASVEPEASKTTIRVNVIFRDDNHFGNPRKSRQWRQTEPRDRVVLVGNRTLMLTSASAESICPSLTLKVNASFPVKPGFGL